MGKYARHLIAVVIGAVIAACVQLLGTRFGITFEDEAVRDFQDALTNAVTPMALVWAYAWIEKFLKRYPWLDPEGYVSREAAKAAVARRENL